MKTIREYFKRSKAKLISVQRWPYLWLACLVLVSLFLHLTVIQTPNEHVFDEKWYVVDAGHIADGDGSFIPQHPPLARLVIAGGITLFGDNPFGWRIFPVLFGLAGIILLYLICRELKLPHLLALMAASLMAFENLSFVQSSIAMLDVFSVTLMLTAFYVYLKGRYLTSGVLIAISMLAKFTGILAIPVIGLHWLLTNRREWFRFSLAIALVPVVYLLLLPVLDWFIWGKFINPITETVTMLQLNSYSTFAEITSTMLSRPWEWLLGLPIITYWVAPHYLAMISPNLWLVTIPALIYMGYKARKGNNASIFCLAWFIGTYLAWWPISLVTDRTSYIFYFYPTVGTVCIAVAISLWDITKYQFRLKSPFFTQLSKWAITIFLILHVGFLIYLSPVPYVWKLVIGAVLYMGIRYIFSAQTLGLQMSKDPSLPPD